MLRETGSGRWNGTRSLSRCFRDVDNIYRPVSDTDCKAMRWLHSDEFLRSVVRKPAPAICSTTVTLRPAVNVHYCDHAGPQT
jgi:hypothetical protein